LKALVDRTPKCAAIPALGERRRFPSELQGAAVGIRRLVEISQFLDRYGHRDFGKPRLQSLKFSQEIFQKPMPLGVILTFLPFIDDQVDEQPEHVFGIRPVDEKHRSGSRDTIPNRLQLEQPTQAI
jgi:hypothetical protein